MKKKFVAVVLLGIFLISGCSAKTIEGKWQMMDDIGKGEKLAITKTQVILEEEVLDNEALNYEISEDGKHLILSQGEEEESVSYQLDGDKLSIEDDTYYRIDSKAYKEQEKKIEE